MSAPDRLSMIRIKICGITRRQDAEAAAELGADFIGFNFYPPSPRFIRPNLARSIQADLPETILSVGVFVNPELTQLLDIASQANLSILQLHGDETPDFCARAGLPVIKAFRLAGPQDIVNIKDYHTWGVLLDSPAQGYGGSGKVFDWSLASKIQTSGRVFLAGGLTPENVATAISVVCPWAVDVASGVESAPGIKDLEKMKRFIEAVKNADSTG